MIMQPEQMPGSSHLSRCEPIMIVSRELQGQLRHKVKARYL